MFGMKTATPPAPFVGLLRGGLLLAVCLLAPCAAPGQEQGVTPPKDTIFARKILMGAISENMDEIETMLATEGHLNLAEGQEHADMISIMLMAFPHMFPASTNQWVAGADRDPATDTYASPEVWVRFPDFYRLADAASKIAFAASRAKRADEFKAQIVQLRAACDGCHAVFQKVD
jgi:cytochrome c556